MPSADDFAALARSSPWRWSTLRFTVRWPGDRWRTEALRAWVRRPDRLRVETTAGELVQVVREGPHEVAVLGPGGGFTRVLPTPGDRGAPRPVLRPDGLVAERPARWEVDLDDPMHRDYFWVAMLDPAELADGRDPETDAASPALDIGPITEVEHAGRPAWDAVVRTTAAYEPRCACCWLLRSRELDVRAAAAGDVNVVDDPADYPTAHRVRLDVGTGVCVLTAAVGGARPGSGHDLRIEAVDEPLDGALFVARRQ